MMAKKDSEDLCKDYEAFIKRVIEKNKNINIIMNIERIYKSNWIYTQNITQNPKNLNPN